MILAVSLLTLITFIVCTLYMLIKLHEFKRLRQMYIAKFNFYKVNGYVQDSYCNIYIEIFSKFRFHMFIKFWIYGHTTLYELTDNISLYSNYKISRQKIKQSKIDPKEANEVFVYWRDQQL